MRPQLVHTHPYNTQIDEVTMAVSLSMVCRLPLKKIIYKYEHLCQIYNLNSGGLVPPRGT